MQPVYGKLDICLNFPEPSPPTPPPPKFQVCCFCFSFCFVFVFVFTVHFSSWGVYVTWTAYIIDIICVLAYAAAVSACMHVGFQGLLSWGVAVGISSHSVL